MTEVEKLQKRLQEMGVKHFHVYPGHGNPPAEDIAKEVNRIFDMKEAGLLKEAYDVEYGLDFDSRDECEDFYRDYPRPTWSTKDKETQDTYLARAKEYQENIHKFHKKWKDARAEHKEMARLGY